MRSSMLTVFGSNRKLSYFLGVLFLLICSARGECSEFLRNELLTEPLPFLYTKALFSVPNALPDVFGTPEGFFLYGDAASAGPATGERLPARSVAEPVV